MSCYNRDYDDLLGFVFAMYLCLCEQDNQSLGLTDGLRIGLPASHALSCIGTTNSFRTSLNPLNKIFPVDMELF